MIVRYSENNSAGMKYGIEPMVILKDICGANDCETEAVVRWMMDALVDKALREAAARPVGGKSRRKLKS